MGYIKHLLHEYYMLGNCQIHFKCHPIIYQLGVNFINMYLELHFLSSNKIIFILAILWIIWITN